MPIEAKRPQNQAEAWFFVAMPTYPDDRRESAAKRGYGRKWQRARLRFLKENPLCCWCAKQGRTRAATVVDHITPHRGDKSLMWDRKNWQPLCKHCHDSHKQRLEKSGTIAGCTEDGLPIDPNHHWAKAVGGPKTSKPRRT